MPDASTMTNAVAATLELESGVCLGGTLSQAGDDTWLLAEVKLLSGLIEGGKLSLRPGAHAQLNTQSGKRREERLVVIANATESSITLRASDEAISEEGQDLSAIPLTGATAEYTAVLADLHRHSLQGLEQLVQSFLKELGDHLFDLSSAGRSSGSDQNVFYDALVYIRHQGSEIVDQVLQRVDQMFHELTPESDADAPWAAHVTDIEDLGLVGIREFESSLAIDRMMSRGEEMHGRAMEAITLRLGLLVEADPNRVRNPLHLRHLGRCMQQALSDEHFNEQVVPALLQFLAQEFIHPLGDYYAGVNELLADRGVQPEVEKRIASSGSLLKKRKSRQAASKKKSDKRKAGKEGATLAEAARTEGAKFDGVHIPADMVPALENLLANLDLTSPPGTMYRSVVNALNFRREAQGLAPAGADSEPLAGTWDGATVSARDAEEHSLADGQLIAQALGAIQRDAAVRKDVQHSDSLRAYLAENRERMGQLRDTTGLTAESLNQLDLVDNLFGTIKSQLDVTSELRPALGNLQIPLAKLALLDPRFFLDRQHTARAVVDRLSQLAASGNFPNKALENRISTIVEDIVSDYETDNSVFDTALEKLERLSRQQEQARARNVERVVRTQEGQERLRKARKYVNGMLAERFAGPAAPRVLLDLIDSGWRDLLVLTHVKQGPDSQTWKDQVNTLDLLGRWLTELHQGEADEDQLMQRALQAEPLIDQIEQEITTALPTQVVHQKVMQELREILAGVRAVDTTDIEERLQAIQPNAAEVRARIEDLPRLRRWVKRVEQLEVDSWLNYRGRDNQKHRMRLAWISEDKDRYIFVNDRGQKVADLSAVQLARQLSRGVQPPAPADKLSVVDQSLYETLEHAQKTLSFARNHDSLTRLINRETFLDQMQRALRHAQLKDTQHAVLSINIDQFSLVNEVYDRVTGDQILLEFARLLAQLHGKKASSARLHGDHFAVLLLDRDMEQAVASADKIRQDIEAGSVEIDGEKVSFTVSIGVAPVVGHSPAVEQILDSARAAMLRAKQAGRNQVLAYEEDQERPSAHLEEKSRTRQDLQEALSTDRFVLRAQPIVQTSVEDGSTVSLHYELLLGIRDKDGSLGSPEDFIVSAEKYGFMNLVDRWVVKEAFSWISKLMDEQKVVPNLAINLSGTSVTEDSFMDYLLEQISDFGVGTSRICFEITETGTISNLVKAADFVRTFRNIGCKFSIDDFGTGLASHNYLRELPVDYVKIDGTFVRGIHENRNDYAMARSINDLAHFLGQETIAESVENDQIIEKLQEISVDYLQGWGIARPKLLSEVAEDLSSIDK
jgi:diguanylate cyclase (GGDEF)-like protein